MTVLELLKDLGIFGIIVAAIGWLAKKLGEHQINKNLKIYELTLNQQLEKYKSDLELVFQKSSKLHDKRLDKIHELYGLLIDFYIDIEKMVKWRNVTGMTDQEIEEQNFNDAKKTYESGHAFSMYFEKNKLYFEKDTCEKIEGLLKELQSSQYDLTVKYQWMNISPKTQIEMYEKARESIERKVPELKKDLEEDFRNIIGVKDNAIVKNKS